MEPIEINHLIFADKIEPIIHCGKNIGFYFTGGEYKRPYKTNPLPEWEHTLKTCAGCNKNHKKILIETIERFKDFPHCCEFHRKLIKESWFNLNHFTDYPIQFTDKLFYSWFHILQYVDTEDWRKEVFDYLEYIANSFGTFPNGFGEPLYFNTYLKYLKSLISTNIKSKSISNKELSRRKKEIIEYLDSHNKPQQNTTDFNILISTYNKWLKVFPFEISFFANLKPHFEKQLPIFNGKPETNKYTGIAKAKMHTKGSLIDVLLNLTNNLLTQINTTTLYEKGLLTEPQKIKLELVLNERKMKLKQGYVNSSKNEEQRYRKILKEWFADEKRFIDEVTPLVKALPPQPIIESPFSVLEWATIFYYADETKLLSESRLLKTRLEQFMSKHQVNTTSVNFKNSYYEAKRRINEKNDYPINKLELIIPFLKENYKLTVAKVENDIFFLKENKSDY